MDAGSWPPAPISRLPGADAGRAALGEAQIAEDLGEAQIEGLAARGMRITAASYMVEVWTALAIDQPPILVRRKEPSREETKRLFNVRTGDPDPALFAPLDAR